MKPTKLIAITTLIVGLGTAHLFAQDDEGPQGPPAERHRPPPLPIVQALDTNHDGVIDASEIAAATESLKKLDKNNDGKLTRDEYLPPRPSGPRDGHGDSKGHRPPPPPDEEK